MGTFFREEPWSPVVKDVEGLECDNDVITLYFRMLTLACGESIARGQNWKQEGNQGKGSNPGRQDVDPNESEA